MEQLSPLFNKPWFFFLSHQPRSPSNSDRFRGYFTEADRRADEVLIRVIGGVPKIRRTDLRWRLVHPELPAPASALLRICVETSGCRRLRASNEEQHTRSLLMMQKPEIKTKVVRRTEAQFSCLISKSNLRDFDKSVVTVSSSCTFPFFAPLLIFMKAASFRGT